MACPKQGETTRQIDWAKDKFSAAGFQASAHLMLGDPEVVIARVIKEESIDLLVMGAYSHSPIRALLFGSKTNELLRSASVPTLLVR